MKLYKPPKILERVKATIKKIFPDAFSSEEIYYNWGRFDWMIYKGGHSIKISIVAVKPEEKGQRLKIALEPFIHVIGSNIATHKVKPFDDIVKKEMKAPETPKIKRRRRRATTTIKRRKRRI